MNAEIIQQMTKSEGVLSRCTPGKGLADKLVGGSSHVND